MSGQGSSHSSSTGYPGHRQQQQQTASYHSSDNGSSYSSTSSVQNFGKIAAAVPMATHNERQAAMSRFASGTPDYGHPHHKQWSTPGASPASSWEPEPSHWQLGTMPYANSTLGSAPGSASFLAPSGGTPSSHARSASGDAPQHYAAAPPSRLRNEITSSSTTPPVANPGARPHNYYAVPASQASSGARYNPPTRCNYCGHVVEFAKLEAHRYDCPGNPPRAQQSGGSGLPAPPVTVLAHHQWKSGGTPSKRAGNP